MSDIGEQIAFDQRSHQPKPIRQLAIRIGKRIPFLSNWLMRVVRGRRSKKELKLAKDLNWFPKDLRAIGHDYQYSIQRTHRGIMQVLNIEASIRHVVAYNIEGAFVETGTFTGGASAYALLALKRLTSPNTPTRPYWGFDSFEGMPNPSEEDEDHGAFWLHNKPLSALSIEDGDGSLVGHDVNKASYRDCKAYLLRTGYEESKIRLVKGWFQDTLPKSADEIGKIAILRLDGDFYESTKVVLELLYENVQPGGIIIVDDYGAFPGCKKAVDEFLDLQPVRPHLTYVEHSIRYFIKP